jgi:hypothetical protein
VQSHGPTICSFASAFRPYLTSKVFLST